MKKTFVISAVNFTEGGPLTVLRDCVEAAAETLSGWRVVVMAHDASLINVPGVEVITFPYTKKSWLRRLFLEWYGFKTFTKQNTVDLWLSLHDITPNVIAKRQVVYCHNPSPFSTANWRDSWFDPKYLAFTLFYGFLYAMNIQKNHSVVVQQEWIRAEFKRRFRVDRVIVARPDCRNVGGLKNYDQKFIRSDNKCIFFFPALPRCFKNFELIGEAVEILERSNRWTSRVRWTINGTENSYTRWLRKRFGRLRSIDWIGRLDREEMIMQYSEVDCLIFPSRVETWGLPISEAKSANLPMLLVDLPYAHETVGNWDRVAFFPPNLPSVLAQQMALFATGELVFTKSKGVVPEDPFADGWRDLLLQLTCDL